MEPDFVRRGRELTARGAHLEAVKVCRLGLLAHPSQLDGRLILGHALLALGRFDEVLAEMRVALELDGLNGTAMSLKGEALLGRGDARQALDVLEKAVRYDPANDRVPALLEQARQAAAGGSRGAGDVDDSISWTRDYPGFQPGSRGGGDSSDRTTLPGQPTRVDPLDLFVTADTELADLALFDADEPTVNQTVETIEIDPEVEGIEIRETPSPPAASDYTVDDAEIGGPTVLESSPFDEDNIELSSSDLIPADPELRASAALEPPKATDEVRGFDDGFGSASDPTHGYRGRREIEEEEAAARAAGDSGSYDAPLFLDSDPDQPKSSGFPTDVPRPRPSFAPRDVGGQHAPTSVGDNDSGPVLDALFPEDEDGVSKLEIPVGDGLHAFEKAPHQGPRPVPSSLPSERPRPPSSRPSPMRGDDTRERRRSADMRVIREGLGLSSDPSRGALPTAVSPGGLAVSAPPRRQAPPTSVVATSRDAPVAKGRRISVIGALILSLLLLGGGVAGGVVLRGWRTERQLDAAAERARQLLETGNYLDHLRAGALLDRALELSDRPGLRALRARVSAAVSDEFGVAGGAAERVEALGDDGGLDARVARARMALVRGEIASALDQAAAIAEAFPAESIGPYLRGRGQLERGQLDAAKATFEGLHKAGSTPLITARLAEVNRLSGRFEVARAVAGDGGDLPALMIARARAAAGAGALPGADEPEATLESLIADGLQPPSKQTIGVSPRQVAEARLALVELGLARGKPERARAQLAALAETKVDDGPFLAAYTEALVAVGDDSAASAAHARLAKLWPDNPRTVVLAARLALRAGDLRAARAAIDSLPSADSIPQARAVRGELALAAGRLVDAVKDLDAAIAANPGLIDASLARARVDLARGKPRDALDRLDKLPAAYARERDIIRARALRMAGEVEQARSLLATLAKNGFGPASLELARLERSAGAFDKALEIYGKMLAANPADPVAALEKANLEFEQGEPTKAKKALEALVAAQPNDAQVVLATARIKSLTGDPKAALERVEAASKIAGTPKWQVDRERGRALMRLRKFSEASEALSAAAEVKPTDGDTWLLLMEIHLRGRDATAAAELLKKATVPLDNSHVLALLRGMEALASDQLERAVRDFQTALVVARSSSTRFEQARLRYWKGRAHEALGQLGKARAELARAVKLDPRNADAFLMLGEVEFQDRKKREAIANYRRSAELDPVSNPKVHFYLGELYIKARKKRSATKSLETFLELAPDDPLATEARRMLDEIR